VFRAIMDKKGILFPINGKHPCPAETYQPPLAGLQTVQTNPERLRQPSGGKMKTRSDPQGRNRSSTVLVIFLLLFLAAMPAETGSAAGERLTLDEAVRMALKNNHELQAQRNAHAAKGAEIGIARSSLLPRISLEERYLRTAGPAYSFMAKLNQQRIEFADFAPDTLNHPSAVNDFQTAVTFEQPLFVKKADIGLEMSKMEASASEEALHRKKEEVAF
jgi:outer membrane protein TolC